MRLRRAIFKTNIGFTSFDPYRTIFELDPFCIVPELRLQVLGTWRSDCQAVDKHIKYTFVGFHQSTYATKAFDKAAQAAKTAEKIIVQTPKKRINPQKRSYVKLSFFCRRLLSMGGPRCSDYNLPCGTAADWIAKGKNKMCLKAFIVIVNERSFA